ncbi:late histone H2B.L4-like [Senna tora]|uniref:Late histone H2B.L4-like n=1 Tax=Senna tora TaxID=362788 RepID=A0A834TLW3_9FABA|nr:late histone H2B.L4-like [Senna tora]
MVKAKEGEFGGKEEECKTPTMSESLMIPTNPNPTCPPAPKKKKRPIVLPSPSPNSLAPRSLTPEFLLHQEIDIFFQSITVMPHSDDDHHHEPSSSSSSNSRHAEKTKVVEVSRRSKRLTRSNYKITLSSEEAESTITTTEVEATHQSTEKRKRRIRRRRRKEGYQRYVYKVLKQVHPEMGISGEAMTIINNLMNDMFERLAEEASRLSAYTGRRTLSCREMQGAVKLVLPGELGKHANAEAVKAVLAYISYDA